MKTMLSRPMFRSCARALRLRRLVLPVDPVRREMLAAQHHVGVLVENLSASASLFLLLIARRIPR